ncbi:MAG: hypothetical protein RMK29_13390 [Myxococcales bacterium]|nr:hypothetical protein [Myxococcota bacterium]MDW8282701.1 hypothetical protein [Myxococcales bacterium]
MHPRHRAAAIFLLGPLLSATLCRGERGASGAAPLAPPRVEIQWFATPAEALGPILARKPRVIAFGEYHAVQGAARVRSALRRFVDQMLPFLLYWPSDLIVETWVTQGQCGDSERTVAQDVRRTIRRPPSTQNEIVSLLRGAREIGIQPHILQVSCAEYQALLDDKGQVDYDGLLKLLTRLLARKVSEVSAARQDPVRPILVYGGALHNDLDPKEAFRPYSFGPQLLQETRGRYLEVDLYVPEYVARDPEVTESAWYRQYRQELRPRSTALVRRGPFSYVVMFPPGW